MGFKIYVVDELPQGLDDVHEPPYRFEEWVNVIGSSSSARPAWFAVIALIGALLFIGH